MDGPVIVELTCVEHVAALLKKQTLTSIRLARLLLDSSR
jgi:hypothetical protein